MLHKLIGGGQTGADRAARDAGLALGLPVGGGCPKGRRAERCQYVNCGGQVSYLLF